MTELWWKDSKGKMQSIVVKGATEMRDEYDESGWVENIVLSRTRPVANKEHTCTSCKESIVVGQQYVRTVSLIDGSLYTQKIHKYCGELGEG